MERSHSREGRAVVETNPPVTTNSEPPPTKRRKKERGQNKRRPRAAKVNRSDQLCPSLYQGSDRSDRSCQFGEKCRYCHDTAAYLAKKPPDIGSTCHLFDTLGRCPYGLACRCGNSHMTSDLQNVTDEQVYDPNRIETTINVISRTLQENLRKKRIELPKSERFLHDFSRGPACRGNVRGDGGGGKGGEGEGDKVREEGEKEREGADENGESGATEEDMADLGEGHLTTEKAECSAGDGDGVAVTAVPEGVSSSAERTMSGAVTDEDLIRMRPEEIKQVYTPHTYTTHTHTTHTHTHHTHTHHTHTHTPHTHTPQSNAYTHTTHSTHTQCTDLNGSFLNLEQDLYIHKCLLYVVCVS